MHSLHPPKNKECTVQFAAQFNRGTKRVFSVTIRKGPWVDRPTPPPMVMPSHKLTWQQPVRSKRVANLKISPYSSKKKLAGREPPTNPSLYHAHVAMLPFPVGRMLYTNKERSQGACCLYGKTQAQNETTKYSIWTSRKSSRIICTSPPAQNALPPAPAMIKQPTCIRSQHRRTLQTENFCNSLAIPGNRIAALCTKNQAHKSHKVQTSIKSIHKFIKL